jgi:hypothetical protein
MEAVLHTSDDCIFVTEDHGNPRETRVVNAERDLRCCTEDDKEKKSLGSCIR